MKTMNGFTNELLVKKAKRNWRTRCGAFLLAVLASWYGGDAVFGQATLTTDARWGQYTAIDDQQTAARVAPLGPNIGAGAGYDIQRAGDYSVTWEIAQNHQYGLDLFDVASGVVEAYVLFTPDEGDPYRVDNYTFTAADDFASNGAEFTVSQNVIWTGNFDATGGIFNTLGNELTVTGNFTNAGTFTINAGTGNGGFLNLSNGSNTGVISIGSGGLRLTSNNFSNAAGTINIEGNGILAVGGTFNLAGNVWGAGSENARGMLVLEDNTGFSNGNWGGSMIVSGSAPGSFNGYTLDVSGITSNGLTTLRITDGANIIVDNQMNIDVGAQIIFDADYGSITKDTAVDVLTLGNNIRFDDTGGIGQANFEASGDVVDVLDSANSIADGTQRIILTGAISSDHMRNQTFNVNALGGNGAISLQGNSNYMGSYHVHSGTLEVDNAGRLGPSGNPSMGDLHKIRINDGAFRVVNMTDQIFERYIQLDSAASTIEVYTGNIANPTDAGERSNRDTMADANRMTMFQTGAIYGTGSLTKSGDGRLVLAAGANSYQGDTIIRHGILSISSNTQINDNDRTRSIILGSADLDGTDYPNYRPVFETTTNAIEDRYGEAKTISINNAKIQINQQNAVIRTTGALNETIINTEVTSVVPNAMTLPPVLNKEGAGILSLYGQGNWGYERAGETNIRQGTIQFANRDNLAKGAITIGTDALTFRDLEGTVADYQAGLRLTDNAGFQDLPNNVVLGSALNSFIEVGIGSTLSVNRVSENTGVQAELNKMGAGELVLNGNASYTGWTRIQEGQLTANVVDGLMASAGVDLLGYGTTFDMSTASQTLQGLQGVDALYADSPDDWSRRVNIGNQRLTLNQQAGEATLHGAILGTGTFVKAGIAGSNFMTGFEIGEEKFQGGIDIQTGTLTTLTDATFTGFTGRAGTFFDLRDNTVTVNIADNQAYLGTVISSYPTLPYNDTMKRPHLIKDGAGTWSANFSETNPGSGVRHGFGGDLTILGGKIISTSDFYMAGGSVLTFGVQSDTSTSNVATLDVSKHSAMFVVGGESGNEGIEVRADMSIMTGGLKDATGPVLIGKVLGNDQSDYSGLVPEASDSMFYTLTLEDVRATGRHDKYVYLRTGGFEGIGTGVGDTAMGRMLDNVLATGISDTHPLSRLLTQLWEAGVRTEDDSDESYQQRQDLIRGVVREMKPDTIANAMFMGLDKPWQTAFDRLNLDSQMVYVGPPQEGRPRAIANMRNLWFTPTVQSLTARSDGSVGKFGIDRPGYKIGFDKRIFQNTSVGFQLGYSNPTLRQDDDRVEGSDFQFGIYGGSMVGNYIEMKGFIGFGHQTYKSNRNLYLPGSIVDWNPSVATHGRFDGDTFNFSFEVSRPLFLGFTILRPTIGLDSEHAFRYAFTETGDETMAMSFGRSSLSRTRARFGLSLETTTLDRAIFTGRLGYSCLLGGNDYSEVDAQLAAFEVKSEKFRSVAVGKSYFEAGVGTRIFLNPVKTLALVGNYDATVGNRWAEHQGVVGFSYVY